METNKYISTYPNFNYYLTYIVAISILGLSSYTMILSDNKTIEYIGYIFIALSILLIIIFTLDTKKIILLENEIALKYIFIPFIKFHIYSDISLIKKDEQIRGDVKIDWNTKLSGQSQTYDMSFLKERMGIKIYGRLFSIRLLEFHQANYYQFRNHLIKKLQ